MSRCALSACAAIGLVGMLAVATRAADGPGIDAKTAFAKLKTLAGEWTAETEEQGGHGGGHQKVVYRVTARGSALMQHQFPGTDHEMIGMDHRYVKRNPLNSSHFALYDFPYHP